MDALAKWGWIDMTCLCALFCHNRFCLSWIGSLLFLIGVFFYLPGIQLFYPFVTLFHEGMNHFFTIEFLLLMGEKIIFHLCVVATFCSRVICKNADACVFRASDGNDLFTRRVDGPQSMIRLFWLALFLRFIPSMMITLFRL